MKIVSIVPIVAMTLSLSVAANVSFDNARALLWSDGYTLIKMRNGDAQQLTAFDTEGSPVLISISPPEGDVSSIEYVHAMDK